MKKRILFTGEASFLNTGFSNIYRELLPRLVKTGKYLLAEQGSYARADDSRIHDFIRGRWKFYPVMPMTEAENAEFNDPKNFNPRVGQNTWQFGEGKFSEHCADFKPDIISSLRDNWMDFWIGESPFRNYFKWIWMPTLDSMPQKEDWIIGI